MKLLYECYDSLRKLIRLSTAQSSPNIIVNVYGGDKYKRLWSICATPNKGMQHFTVMRHST